MVAEPENTGILPMRIVTEPPAPQPDNDFHCDRMMVRTPHFYDSSFTRVGQVAATGITPAASINSVCSHKPPRFGSVRDQLVRRGLQMSVEQSKKPFKFTWKWVLCVLGVGAICVLATLQIDTRSQSGSASTTTPTETVNVSIPPNSLGPAGTVGVAIPGRIIDKLGPPHDTGLAGIWPAVTVLLGTLAGAALTFATTSQKNKQDRIISEEARQQATADRIETRRQEIRDHSLQACLEVITAGRLVAMATRTLWVHCANKEPRDKVEESFSKLDPVLRDWYIASEVLLLRMPPVAKTAFIAYREALNKYVQSATRWSGDYLASIPAAAQPGSPPGTPIPFPPRRHTAIKCKRLENDVLTKREVFVDIANDYFREGAFSAT
jgi:hypothetical protein